ncbi:MAG: SDR family oxidoreductase [Vulcanimicrobiaceae bacterium]|jgi:NAD(P)-dependent dehydrogenase (short-subunit alcohol dehydrogenase family)
MNKVALVTGAGSGIGRASAIALAEAGFTTVLLGRKRETLDETASQAPNGKTLAIAADVGKESDVTAAFDTVREKFGRLDVLFNNAGAFGPTVPFEELGKEDWDAVVAVNLTGAFLCARAAYRIMKDQTPMGGRIINNGSIAAYAPRPHTAPYAATKHGISGLTKLIALEGRKYDIACGQIDIGNATTEMISNITSRRSAGMLQADGSRVMEPQMDVVHTASAVVYMAQLPLDTNVQFLTIMATKMPYLGRG